MDPEKDCKRMLKDSGATIVRQGKHTIWKLPNGKLFTSPGHTHGWRGWQNARSVLRKIIK